MTMLSHAEMQYLMARKQVSKSYEYKLKSIIKKKLSHLIDKEITSLKSLFPGLDLIKNGRRSEWIRQN